MPEVSKRFSDFDLSFTPHPVSGDITTLVGVDAVKKSVRNLILTNVWERIFRPNLGSGIAQLLFEPVNPLTQRTIEATIKDVIRVYEKRVTLTDVIVTVNSDQNGYDAIIKFIVDSESALASISVFLERIR
jgi:phage baseplate assembly protein W